MFALSSAADIERAAVSQKAYRLGAYLLTFLGKWAPFEAALRSLGRLVRSACKHRYLCCRVDDPIRFRTRKQPLVVHSPKKGAMLEQVRFGLFELHFLTVKLLFFHC